MFSLKDAYIVVQCYSKESNNASFINPSTRIFNVGCIFKETRKVFDCLVNFESAFAYINQKHF